MAHIYPEGSATPAAAWLAEAERLFGKDPLQWKFRCPVCGHIQTMADFKALGTEPQDAYQQCIGRKLPRSQRASNCARVPAPETGKRQPCDYAAFGLLPIGTRPVITETGKIISVFPFAEAA